MKPGLLGVIVVCAGCGTKGAGAGSKSAGSSSNSAGNASCKAQVDELMTFLRAMDTSAPLLVDRGVELVTRTDIAPGPTLGGPLLTIAPEQIMYDIQPVTFDDLSL